jgi:hypothetical protein
MRKWLVAGVETMTAKQEKEFIGYLRRKGLGWWHWIPNIWLLTGSNVPDCSEIRDELKIISDGADVIVLEVNPITWSGFGPKTDENNMFNWLHKSWHT